MTMMKDIVLGLLGAVAFDWLFANGMLARYASSVDYRYWPPSRLRMVTWAFLAGAAILLVHDEFRAEWPLLLTIFAFIVYGAAIMADAFQAQGWDEDGPSSCLPPRYSEP